MMYFQLRTGALKSWLLQRLAGDFTYLSSLGYTEYVSLMGEHQLPEMQTEEVFTRFLDDRSASGNTSGTTTTTSTTTSSSSSGVEEGRISVKELVLTLIALCQMDDADDDAFITFLKFDINGDGFISRVEMEMLFRSILEEEALQCMEETEGTGSGSNDLEERGSDCEVGGLVDIEGEMVAIEGVLRAITVTHEKGIDFSEFKNFFDMAMKISNSMSMRLSMNMSVRISMRLMNAAQSAKMSVATRKKPETRKQLSA
jgi:hypothetical protein